MHPLGILIFHQGRCFSSMSDSRGNNGWLELVLVCFLPGRFVTCALPPHCATSCFIGPMFCYSLPSRMFIRSPHRNMTGKAWVFIFPSPSLHPFPSPPLLRSSLSLFFPLSSSAFLHACPILLCTPLRDEMSSKAAPVDFFFPPLSTLHVKPVLLASYFWTSGYCFGQACRFKWMVKERLYKETSSETWELTSQMRHILCCGVSIS